MELLMIFFIVFGLVLTILGAVSVGSINRLKDNIGTAASADQSRFMRDARNSSVGVLVIGIIIMVLAGIFLFTMKGKNTSRSVPVTGTIEMPTAPLIQGMHGGKHQGGNQSMKHNVRRYYF